MRARSHEERAALFAEHEFMAEVAQGNQLLTGVSEVMASRKTAVNEVEVGVASLDRFRRLLGEAVWSELERAMSSLKDAMGEHVLWNVNSTAKGGGVAEMLASLIPYERDAGIDERW